MEAINILLVEDDLALAKAMKYTLEREGFKVEDSSSVKATLEILKVSRFDLILLDITLPDGSGYDICSYVRKNSNLPIIFITACDDEANVVLGLDIGGDDYISKPVRIRELISRINAVLRRKTNKTSDEKLISRDIEINLLKCSVTKNDSEIMLSTMEYKLLVAFIKNKGQVLTREKILSKLWDMDGEFVDDNTLSVYIKRLRDKLGEEKDGKKYIHTVRGIGYKWLED